MSYLLDKAMTPRVLNHAWSLMKEDRSQWQRGMSRKDMEPDLLQHIGQLREDVLSGQYRAEPMRCFEIDKADGGKRLICAAPIRDKLIQRAVLTVLEPLGESLFMDASFGFRPRCNREMAMAWLREWVRRGWNWLGDADIRACFDNIPQQGALEFLYILCGDEEIVTLAYQWINSLPARFRPGPEGCGLPQGMVLSPFLCNLYLHALDERFSEENVPFVRYADDFIVMGKNRNEAEQFLAIAGEQLGWLGLELHPEKTRIIRSSPKYSFLGYHLPDGRPRFKV